MFLKRFIINILNFVYACVVCGYVYVHAISTEVRVVESPKAGVTVVSHLTWLLRNLALLEEQ